MRAELEDKGDDTKGDKETTDEQTPSLLPLPQLYIVSPLTRCCQTALHTFADPEEPLPLPHGHEFRPLIKEVDFPAIPSLAPPFPNAPPLMFRPIDIVSPSLSVKQLVFTPVTAAAPAASSPPRSQPSPLNPASPKKTRCGSRRVPSHPARVRSASCVCSINYLTTNFRPPQQPLPPQPPPSLLLILLRPPPKMRPFISPSLPTRVPSRRCSPPPATARSRCRPAASCRWYYVSNAWTESGRRGEWSPRSQRPSARMMVSGRCGDGRGWFCGEEWADVIDDALGKRGLCLSVLFDRTHRLVI